MLAACALATGCASTALTTRPGAFDAQRTHIPFRNRELPVTYVRPATDLHPGYFIVFATGDGGWHGPSAALFTHLAERGYLLAGLSSPEVLNRSQKPHRRFSPAQATANLANLFAAIRRDLGVGSSASMVVVGFSRGANIVAYTAMNQRLHVGLAGTVAIGLTREDDYVRGPTGRRRSHLKVDRQGRLETYSSLAGVTGTKLAVIQSTNDHYVPAAESRALLGPDTDERRLYAVEARSHAFGGGRDVLFRDLDDALAWIERKAQPQAAAP
ncbi:MAG TPA: AcvB/VirJ family lysyl-phosphatidylglycerol hydrolase [Gammaproteobacteria bacterium]|nr:AcvB/VirJ family lysyl-phosphatidylglycerol hydrolase [Gammaproteobacteria bacterium]